MVKFVEVKPESVVKVESRARGRFAHPILYAFIDSGLYMAKIDRTEDPSMIERPLMSVYSSLNQAAKQHKMPVQVLQVDGEVYLKRIDITMDGKPIPNWDHGLVKKPKKSSEIVPSEEAVDIDEITKKT
jgi:hypothetical protein